MELSIQLLLGLVALIGFAGGANLMLKGAQNFLPKDTKTSPILDDLFRFLSGIYFGAGFLYAYMAFHVSQYNPIVYFLGIIVVFSGLGRLYSRLKMGFAGTYFDVIMTVEVCLGIAIILLNWLEFAS